MRKIAKRILSTILAALMVIPLAGCKHKTKKKTVSASDPYFNTTQAELVLEGKTGKTIDRSWIDSTVIIDNNVAATYSIVYKLSPEEEAELEQLYMGELTEKNYLRIMEIENKQVENGIAFFDLEGKEISKLTFDSMYSTSVMKTDGKGNLLLLTSHVDDWNPLTNEIPETVWSICKYSPEGELILKTDLDATESYYFDIFPLEDNSCIVVDYESMAKYSADGKRLCIEKLEDGSLVQYGNKVYLNTYEESGDTYKNYLSELDVNTLKADKSKKKEVTSNVFTFLGFSNSGDKCYSCSTNGIEIIDPLSDKRDMFMEWDSVDFNYNCLMNATFQVKSEDEIAFIYMDYREGEETEGPVAVAVHLTRAESNPHAGKTYLDMGAFQVPSREFIDYLVEYNTREDGLARIRLHDYAAEMGGESDEEVAKLSEKVYLDLLNGSGPDILLNFSGFSQFNSEEVLVDLNTYIDGVNGLNRDEYFDNVFRAFEKNGKLFQIPVCVDIEGLIGNKEMIGERTGWTYSEFTQIVETLPEDVSVFEDMEYEQLLKLLLGHSMRDLIDYEKKEVYFDGDEFKQILQITKKYGLAELPDTDVDDDWGVVEADIDNIIWVDENIMPPFNPDEQTSPEERMNEGLLALRSAYVYSLESYSDLTATCKGNGIFVGVPSPDGSGVSAQPMLTCAISASSVNKEEAWDFIRHLFDEDAQYKYTASWFSIALNRKAFDRINDDAVAENVKLGKEIEEFRKGHENDDNYIDWWTFDPITQEDRDGFQALVENISSISTADQAVMNIILEEAAAYFADQQSIETVCNNIQNRTANIVRER